MPESERLSLESLTAALGDAYGGLAEPTREHHLEFLRELRDPAGAYLEVRPAADGLFDVTVIAADQVGALSLLAGLFTAHGLDIRSADIFTVALPADLPPGGTALRAGATQRLRGSRPRARPRAAAARVGRALLDIFEVCPAEGDGPPDWEGFEAELRSLTALLATGDLESATERVLERVAHRIGGRATSEPLYPVAIELDATAEATRLSIRSTDTAGFLFEFAAALSTLRANVVRAEVRTAGDETRDTFWLTGEDGRPISDPGRLEELRVAAALVKQFLHLLPGSPHPSQALQQFGAMIRAFPQRAGSPEALDAIASVEVLQRLADLLGVSRFLWEDFLRMQQENLLPVLVDTPGLERRTPREELVALLRAAVVPQDGDVTGDAERRLNAVKDREMFRIDLRHITRRTGFLEFARGLSDLAEATVIAAAELAHARLRAVHGRPGLDSGARDGADAGWAIAALGKLGGRELGFASDIELLFVYEGAGKTDGERSISNHDYFEAFARTVRDSIRARQDGIFELDLRLRPYGTKGALATSLTAFDQYYSGPGAGEQFERLALVRLRAFAGDPEVLSAVQALRDGWVYSGAPLDLSNILGLRRRQATELVPAGEVNAKYSPGGLVDFEYFVQALQIEAGATDPAVRAPGTLEGAELLAQRGYLPPMTAARIQEAYGLLRRLIDALRVVRGNARDLAIPPSDSDAFAYLARRMYYETVDDLARAIEVRMAFGRSLWDTFEDLRGSRLAQPKH